MPRNRGSRRPSVRVSAIGIALTGGLLVVPLTGLQLPEWPGHTHLASRAAKIPTSSSSLGNGTFTFGLRGWTGAQPGLSRLTVEKAGRGGTRAATITASRAGVATLRNRRANSAVDLVPGDRITVAAWVRTNQLGRSVVLAAQTRDGTRRVQAMTSSTYLGDTRWHRVSQDFTIARDASNLLVQIKLPSLAAGRRVVVDNVVVRNAALRRRVSTGFDSVRKGQLRPEDFIRTVGGNNQDPQAYEDTFVVDDSRGTGRVLRTRLEANTIHSQPSGNNGIVAFVPLGKRLERGCISYQIRFDGQFDWSMGGKLPGLEGVLPGVPAGYPTGGRRPGDKAWSGRMMWVSPGADQRTSGPNTALSYMYGPTQHSQYGDNELWGRHFRAGRWHTVMQCYRMNAPGRADGVLRGWFDGRLVLDRSDFVYRTRGDLGITHLAWSIFRGGRDLGWAGSRTGYVDIDNLLVTGR